MEPELFSLARRMFKAQRAEWDRMLELLRPIAASSEPGPVPEQPAEGDTVALMVMRGTEPEDWSSRGVQGVTFPRKV